MTPPAEVAGVAFLGLCTLGFLLWRLFAALEVGDEVDDAEIEADLEEQRDREWHGNPQARDLWGS